MALFGRRRRRWEESWALFPGTVNGAFAMYLVDLGALDVAPVAAWQLRLDVTAPYPARDDGMPAEGELAGVQALEDQVSALAGRLGGAYVGRVLTAGTARLACYLPCAPAQLPPLLPLGGRVPLAGVEGDPGWLLLRRQLAPDGRQRHAISDLRVVQALLDRGDQLERPRQVGHLGHFLTAAAAAAAAAELRAAGFDARVEAAERDRFPLSVQRIDPVDPPELHEVTWLVRQTMERYGGSYDGWGCRAQT
jgi:regulator of ribonuclease activity B/uncharacterized protein DUF695